MRPQLLSLAITAVLLAATCPTTTAQRYAVLPREDITSTNDAAAASITHSTTSLSSEATPKSSSDGTSNASATRAKATTAAASSSAALMTATPIPKGSLNVNGTTVPKIEGLPIHPSITPALAVAGPILILSGTLYTLIGIKTKWLHVFLSAAYIFALAVTILIEFVMHTPVSNAAQGGYVVAACLTGLVAGGISFLFQDITEGISCFLGGFCLSMWVLVLRAGGTITNTTGKIIFISCLTVGAPALYFSRYTRAYGLIGSTSFAGATAIILGIDCFSRAGLKEFWLYIWNLNNNIFPLHYSGPYPITRGMQVETGAIIIVCAMGILSQIKIWKIIRRRKEEKAREQRRREEEANMTDEEHGRRIEDGIKRERGSWEAAYGIVDRGKSPPRDSGHGTDESGTRKGSLSLIGTSDVRVSDSAGIELQEVDAPPKSSKEDGRPITHVIHDDIISPAPSAAGQHLGHSEGTSREPSIHDSKPSALASSNAEASLKDAPAPRSLDPNLTLKPETTHLPFKVPDPDSENDDGRSSVAASAASEYTSYRWSNRLSGSSSILRKLSRRSQRSFVAESTSDEALMVADADDDRASSIIATIDGVSVHDDLEEEALSLKDQRPSFEILRKQDSMQALIQESHSSVDLAKDGKPPRSQTAKPTVPGNHQAEDAQHVNAVVCPRPESIALPESDFASTTDAQSIVEEPSMESRADIAESKASDQSPRNKELKNYLPESASKVVTTYRTNEWAKHLDGADLPDIDELNIQKGRAVGPSQPTERVVPVDVRALQQTPLSAEPAPVLKMHSSNERPASYIQPNNPLDREHDTQWRNSGMHQLTREKAIQRRPSQSYVPNGMERSTSQTSLISNKSRKENYRPPLPKLRSSQSSVPSLRGGRSSSSPILGSPLADSPIEEDVEASFPTRFAPSSTHLMSQRDMMIRNRPSSTSLLRTSWSNATLDQHPAMRTLNEDEDIPLSHRKSLLQQNSHSVPHLHRSSSGPISGTPRPMYHPSRAHNRRSATPQPLPGGHPAPTPRDSTYSAWRASLQPSTTARYRDRDIEARRASLMEEKRRDSHSRQEQRVQQTRTQHVMDRGMRQSSMIELHQQQMRKMQAEANRSLAS